jgi:hypothetical protein
MELTLQDGTVFDTVSNILRAADGRTLSRLEEVERVPAGGHKIRKGGVSDHNVTVADIAHKTSLYAHKRTADALGRPTMMRRADGEMQKVLMDLGVQDVHIPGQMAGAAAGYRTTSGIADSLAPVVSAMHQKDSIPVWDKENAFARAQGTTAAPGGDVPTTSISLATVAYSTKERALSIVMPVEVIENADSPLSPWTTATRVVQDKLLIEREFRVCDAAVTAANWDSSVVLDLGAAFGWVSGASADPVKDIDSIVLASFDSTDLVCHMSEDIWLAFQRNPAVQKFIAFKDGIGPRPSTSEMQAILTLPPIVVQKMKVMNSSNAQKYVLTQSATGQSKTGACVITRNTSGLSDPSMISTMKTIRWNGGSAPDGNMVGGWLVRTYFDPKKGGRGSYVVVVVHNDDEIFTSKFVGGLITGVGQ